MTRNDSLGGFKYFFHFPPKIGEDEPILTHIFQRGGSTTNQLMMSWLDDGKKFQQTHQGPEKLPHISKASRTYPAEQRKKPGCLGYIGGLYYPVICGLLINHV